jgi:hypothetical protein
LRNLENEGISLICIGSSLNRETAEKLKQRGTINIMATLEERKYYIENFRDANNLANFEVDHIVRKLPCKTKDSIILRDRRFRLREKISSPSGQVIKIILYSLYGPDEFCLDFAFFLDWEDLGHV